MTDLRSQIIAKLDEWLALCENAEVIRASWFTPFEEEAATGWPATLRALRREVVGHDWINTVCWKCGRFSGACMGRRAIAADLGIGGE